MKYCSVKDCISTSSCKNVILHTIKEQWIAIVKWKTDSPSRISSRHFENKCNRSIYGKKLWNNAVPTDLAETTDFHVQVIKKDHNYTMPYSQETIQLLQDSAEMGMKYREIYNHQKRKKKLWKISRIHIKLRAKNIPSKKVPWSFCFSNS